jgi:hypothetical protein
MAIYDELDLNFESFENFDNEDFPEENVIGIQDTDEIGDGFMHDMAVDETEIQVGLPIKNKSVEEVAKDVEDVLISFLDEERDVIPVLVGDIPNVQGELPSNTVNSFSSSYSQAVLHNPALKWYAKLVNILPENKFNFSGAQLNLKMGLDLFNKIVFPFFNDFKVELREESPIIDLVYSLAESLKEKDLSNKIKDVLNLTEKRENTEEGLEIASLEVDQLDGVDEIQKAELRLEERLFNDEVKDKHPKINISLGDLSNKHLAEYFVEDDGVDKEDIKSKLTEEGFSKQRINEILGIYKYIKLNKNISNKIKPKSNKLGDTEFNFEV